uniref:C-type lectin domain-containing protein n=1 Tax=Panagrolaimus sp. PS1159 TaxID=55785 RepID=A0AC35FAG6_9BILA
MCSDSSQGCVGIYRPTLDTCNLLINIRNIIEDNPGCFYYIADRRNTSDTRKLSTIDQYTFYNAFFDGAKCPKGWNDELINCSYACTAEICSEYAAFFKASYNGSYCIIPSLRIKTYICPGPFKYYTFQNYCFFNLSQNVYQSHSGDYYEEACNNATQNATSVSLHSKAEDQFVFKTFGAIYFCLYIPDDVPWSKTAFRWADGSALDYTHWKSGDPKNDNPSVEERIVGYENDGTWSCGQRYRLNWAICKVVSYDFHYI